MDVPSRRLSWFVALIVCPDSEPPLVVLPGCGGRGARGGPRPDTARLLWPDTARLLWPDTARLLWPGGRRPEVRRLGWSQAAQHSEVRDDDGNPADGDGDEVVRVLVLSRLQDHRNAVLILPSALCLTAFHEFVEVFRTNSDRSGGGFPCSG